MKIEERTKRKDGTTKVFESNGRPDNCTPGKEIRPFSLTEGTRNEPTISPLAEAHAMKCMRTRHSYKAGYR